MARIGSTAGDGCPAMGDHLLGRAVLFGDGVELADSAASSVGLALADGASVRVNKTLSELVLGDLLRQPDVAFAVGKGLTDGAQLGEARAMAVGAALADGVDLADGIAAAVGKAVADGLEVGDALSRTWEIYRDLDDGVYARDRKRIGQIMLGEVLGEPDVDLAVGKFATDGVQLGDSVAQLIGKILAEGIELGDSRAMAVGKGIEDGVLTSDEVATVWAIYRALADGVELSDAEALKSAILLTLKARSLRLTAKER